jgi:hypothetical protein
MTLGTPQDVTVQELRIETFFPADGASERSWRRRMTANSFKTFLAARCYAERQRCEC